MNLSPLFDDPTKEINDFAFSVSQRNKRMGHLIRTDRWAYIQYGEEEEVEKELYDMHYDPRQYNNLALNPRYQKIVSEMENRLQNKLADIRNNDLGIDYRTKD